MEKINIEELLRDCPKGMELDCKINNDVKFIKICPNSTYPIVIKTKNGYEITLTKYGQVHNMDDSECVIFPKGKNTWEGFVPSIEFKDGDVIFTHANCLKVGLGNTWISIFQEKRNGGVATYVDLSEDGEDYYDYIDGSKGFLCMDKDIMRQRLATEEEKEKLFNAIKANGYEWNPESKTLEKLTESKEDTDDRIVMSGIYFDRENYADEVELHLNNYEIEIRDGKTYAIFKNKETKISKPKFKVGDRIKNKTDGWSVNRTIKSYDKNIGYFTTINDWVRIEDQDDWELVPDKFDINTLVPFESRVLVRNDESQYWIPAFWGCKRADGYTTTFGWCKYCIPYEGNEHLLETNKDCDEFYKAWK